MATILIVDDLAANREFLVTLLRYQGHRLIEAADGREALAAARAEHPDLVITDVLMPVMDGYEFFRQLRLDPATGHIPVVFYTAHYGEREARALALSSGVSHVLTKPAEPEEVLRVVGRVLAGTSDTEVPPEGAPLATSFDREHMRLLTDKLSAQTGDLRTANARLRALVNIGLELASERDADRLLRSVCATARDLFGATCVTLGILHPEDGTIVHGIAEGTDAGWMKVGSSVAGILGAVVTERRTIRGSKVEGYPAGLQFPAGHPEAEAWLVAPVASPARVYGWIGLVGNEGRTFSEEDEHLVVALSGQVGRIYENGYFYAIAQTRADQLQREVLERQHVEEALRASENRLREAQRDAMIGSWQYLPDGTLIWSDQMYELFNLPPEVPPTYDAAIAAIYEEDRVRVNHAFTAVLESGDPYFKDEYRIARPDGALRTVFAVGKVQRDAAGRLIKAVGTVQDITERKRIEEDVRLREERMRFALEAAGIGIWDMNYVTGRLTWSEAAEAHYGLKPGSFPGTFEAFVECTHPDDRSSVLEIVGKAMKAGGDFVVQNRSLWPDGTVRWLTGAGRVQLGAHGEPVRAIGISMDVTERRVLEDQFQQAQKMEAIGRLAGGVAHDFNNLLTAILGYCELLMSDLAPADPRQTDVAEIHKAGTAAAGLTRQLLAFSRREIIAPTLLDLNAVVEGMRAMLARLIGEDIRIVLIFHSEAARVKADRGQIEQIILNLAVNARDAMPEGGTLTIETTNIELDEHYPRTHLAVAPGPYVRLTVTDTGNGMTPEVQARIFEPFFTTKGPGKGTGLGLASVHGIVAGSSGTVNVYSEVGKGTTFKIYFPRADASEMPVEASAPAARLHLGSQTVLVVEDSEGLRDLTVRLLRRMGYTVRVAANAEDALRLFEEHGAIDLVLTDVVMPGASGPEMIRRFRERRPELKVIYMSGYTEDAIVQHGVLNPGIAFLNKPFSAETLGRKLREVLDG